MSAPVARAVVARGHQKININGKDFDSIVYDSDELYADVTSAGDGKYADGTLLYNELFNPTVFTGLLRMNVMSKLYARYKVLALWMEILGSGNSASNGAWYAYWDTDPTDNPALLVADNRHRVARAHKRAEAGNWWGGRWEVHAPVKDQIYYTEIDVTDKSDQFWNCAYRFVIGTTATSGLAISSNVLSIVCHAVILFIEPTIEPLYVPQANVSDIRVDSDASASTTNPFGAQPTKPSGSMSFNIVGSGSQPENVPPNVIIAVYSTPANRWILYLAPGKYFVWFTTVGTVLTGLTLNANNITSTSFTSLINSAATTMWTTGYLTVASGASFPYISPTIVGTTATSFIMRLFPVENTVTRPRKQDPISNRIQLEVEKRFKQLFVDNPRVQYRSDDVDSKMEIIDDLHEEPFVLRRTEEPVGRVRSVSQRVTDYIKASSKL